MPHHPLPNISAKPEEWTYSSRTQIYSIEPQKDLSARHSLGEQNGHPEARAEAVVISNESYLDGSVALREGNQVLGP